MVKVKKDLTGGVFGRLTVIEQTEDYVNPSGKRHARWLCQCSCGVSGIIVHQCSLTSGHTSSCGCLNREKSAAAHRTHGETGTKEYKTWVGMIQRCTNPREPAYPYYGGRGITVCQRWLTSFENFLEDMGKRPEGMSLDRRDVDGDYTPNNCRWTTGSEQSYNQRKKGNNSSGRTGVCFDTTSGKWAAYIHKENRQISLGYHLSFEDAVAAREDAELKYYGYTKE